MKLDLPPPDRYMEDGLFQRVHDELVADLQRVAPEQLKKVLDHFEGDLDITFLGFVAQYKALSQLLPLDVVLIDLGCCAAPWTYFFRKHELYIGVDAHVPRQYRFAFPNSRHYHTTIQQWIARDWPIVQQAFPRNPFFAVCQYVPDETVRELVRQTFTNVFCYYPGAR